MCCLCLNACISGTMTKNTVNPLRGRNLEGISGTEGVVQNQNFKQIPSLYNFEFFPIWSKIKKIAKECLIKKLIPIPSNKKMDVSNHF